MINIRQLTLLCGDCRRPLTLSDYSPRPGISVYSYLCESEDCPGHGRVTLLELPRDLDQFVLRPSSDPTR